MGTGVEWRQLLLDQREKLVNCSRFRLPGEMNRQRRPLVSHAHPQIIFGDGAQLGNKEVRRNAIFELLDGQNRLIPLVPRDKGYEAILAVEQLKDRITPHLFVTELRTIAEDDLWMSMAYQRPSLAIHFTWKPEAAAVHELLPLIEKQLAPFDARPHWAKVFTMRSEEHT